MTQLDHSWALTQRTLYSTTEIPAHPCLLLHYSQQQGDGSKPRSPSTDEWIVEMQCSHTQWTLTVKKSEVMKSGGQ